MKTFLKISILNLVIFLFYSCQKDKPTTPTLTTRAITEISTSSAVSGGDVTDKGGAALTSVGVCWNTSPDPTLDNNTTIEPSASITFTSNISQLSPNTTYYVRAYAINSAGTGYGKSVTFKTIGDLPISNSNNATNIQITSATLNGTVNPNSLSTIVTFEYGPTINYGSTITAVQSPITENGSANVSADLSGLLPGKNYHFRVKAENPLGTTYSSDMTFTTLGQAPSVSTLDATNISVSTAKLNGSVNPNYLPTTYFFEWGTDWSYGNTVIPIQTAINGNASVNLSVDLSGLSEGTRYCFRISASNELGTTNGIGFAFTTHARPNITTNLISEITTNSALCGGNIIKDFGTTISEKGICFSTSTNPTIANNKLISNLVGGNFTVPIVNLNPNTTYYLRAYAINYVGVGYGNEMILKTYTGTISDIEGNQYYTVTIGSQLWMAQNLRTTKYQNGASIGTTSSAQLDVSGESNPKYQWAYDGNETNVTLYGRLYSWYAVTDSRSVCPIGWHVPSDTEWTTLFNYLKDNGYGYQGSGDDIAKSMSATSGWTTDPTPGNVGNEQGSNNASGFTAIPSGYRTDHGAYWNVGKYEYWWGSIEVSSTHAYHQGVGYCESQLVGTGGYKQNGFSVRCLKD